MSQPYVGEIRLFAGNFAPAGWVFCDGSLLPIYEYEVLFQLIGTTFGGDGESTFAVPDLRGRAPIHQGSGFVIGEQGGQERVTLTAAQIPPHTHTLNASTGAGSAQGKHPSVSIVAAYGPATSTVAMAANAISTNQGQTEPHENMPPFLVVNYIISLFGVFPSPT